jgi:hypothetical protein
MIKLIKVEFYYVYHTMLRSNVLSLMHMFMALIHEFVIPAAVNTHADD